MAVVTAGLALTAVIVAPTAHGATAAGSHAAFSHRETITRTHLVDNKNDQVDKRNFSVSVGQTQDLRDRQEISVSWSGAHPTGGIVSDPNSALAAQEEYPVVLMMCRGTGSKVSPKTCWTQTPQERFQFSTSNFPSYRLDRYASVADRAFSVGEPSPYPNGCTKPPGADHWIPFVGADGKVYGGGPNLGCAGIPPEAANASSSLQPGNTTYAATGKNGKGNDKFVITTSESNASLGCSDKVACSLVVVPIMGISCDPSGNSLPPTDRPPADSRDQVYADCSQTGAYQPGELSSGLPETEDLAVSGELWWSASNWRNRVVVPLTMAPPSNLCSLVNDSAPTDIYGSYLMLQATQQWAPHFCLNSKLFSFQHVQTSEPEAKNLLETGSITAAFQGSSPPSGFTNSVVQAPTAVTGFGIAFAVDNAKGQAVRHLNLDPRLLAKLLTESYATNSTVQSEYKALTNPKTGKPNPLDLATDPEFRALNPGMPKNVSTPEAAAALLSISSDSDIVYALTSYINADPEARAWLDGKPDPWGMIVNPKYKGIKLPVTTFPLLDTNQPAGLYDATLNPCLARNPVPWLPLVASPLENPASITLNMQFDIAQAQIECSNAGLPNQKLTSIGREAPGQRFLLGLVSLADASRYQLSTASLESQGGSSSSSQFTSTAGRTFVAPNDTSMRAAAQLWKPDEKTGSWPVPYSAMRSQAAGKSAYPGTMLVSTDIPTDKTAVGAQQAKQYAEFLDFAAGAGQVPGVGNGQLPGGYLPMTAANGLGALVNYTRTAAVAVQKRTNQVPSVTGRSPDGHQSTPPTHNSSTPTTSNSTPAGAGNNSSLPAVKTPGGSDSSGPAVAPTGSNAASPVAAAKATPILKSTTAGLVFPLVLLAALIAGAVTATFWRLDRPRAKS